MAKQSVKITVLVDYEAAAGLETEHGFAAWVEVGNHRILFDTGQAGAMQVNAQQLGIDLRTADALVLSHGHFDHTGTLPDFLAANSSAHVYFAQGVHVERFSCKPGTPVRSIGMPETSRLSLAQIMAARVHELKLPQYLYPGVGITGPVPRMSSFEDAGGPFFLDAASHADDLIEDDQSMWFETADGLVILLGCCHAGLANTVDYIRKISGIPKLHGIIGGMHLVNANQQRLDRTFEAIKNWAPAFIVPCHCTGTGAVEQMQMVIGNKIVNSGYAGMVVDAGIISSPV